ncbi:MAG: heparinase II/III family protein [Spartobacteria bacterium]
MKNLLPLNPAEAIFAPFNDAMFASDMGEVTTPAGASGFRAEVYWDSRHVKWENCAPGAVAGTHEVPVEFPWGDFDEFVFCLTVPPGAAVRFLASHGGGPWEQLGEIVEASTTRQEIVRPVPATKPDRVRAEFLAREDGPKIVILVWFGLRDSRLASGLQKGRPRWDAAWGGLIKPDGDWGEPSFPHGLLLDHAGLEGLRERAQRPLWKDHFSRIEERARQAMERAPEDDLHLSDFAPFSDERYVRTEERGRQPLYYDSLRLALVGLVNRDPAMLRHAARFLMAMLHLKHWSPSAETRTQGSTWDQRCFTEEMMTTSAALLLDWLDFLLTDRAREFGRQMLWDRGIAVIERDMAKCEYVHHINQGPWFCRGRLLGSLILEKSWPRFGPENADRAMQQLRDGMNRYLLPDGGMDEGPMYLHLTLETILVACHAYARARGMDPRKLLPDAMPRVPDYLAAVATSSPLFHVPAEDCGTGKLLADDTAMLAALFPGGIYDALCAGSLLQPGEPFNYLHHYAGTGVFAFLLGPDEVPAPRNCAATFSLLPVTGLAGSYRTDGARSLRLTFSGTKARPSHSHADRGGFTAELDGVPVFIDRGVVRYDDPRVAMLKRTENHNTLAPSFDGIETLEQVLATIPLIPDAEGDEKSFRASLDLAHVWPDAMTHCRRKITSEDLDGWNIEDTGELARDGHLVLFLQSPMPFEGEGGSWTCGPVRIEAPWAARADTSEHLIDCEFRPVFRLRLWSGPLRTFRFLTSFRRI